MNSDTLVSVCMITYNHEAFVREAIESILAQKTKFEYELIIGEDCSSDNTRHICQEYALKYKNVILLPSHVNLGIAKNFVRTLQACCSMYVAICEGDDYWTDPLKLQKQVNFLENNPQFSICYHNCFVINYKGEKIRDIRIPAKFQKDFNRSELIAGATIASDTVVFRNVGLPTYKDEHLALNGDIILWSKLGRFGKGKYMSNIQHDAYRIHSGGWTSKPTFDKFKDKLMSHIVIYRNNPSEELIYKRIQEIVADRISSHILSLEFSNMNNIFKYALGFKEISFLQILWLSFIETVKSAYKLLLRKILKSQ